MPKSKTKKVFREKGATMQQVAAYLIEEQKTMVMYLNTVASQEIHIGDQFEIGVPALELYQWLTAKKHLFMPHTSKKKGSGYIA